MRYNKLKMTLSADSIDNVLKAIKDAQKEYKKQVDLKLQDIADDGVNYAINIFGHVDSGETISSIRAVKGKGGKYHIIAGGSSIWWEFGTGVRAESPHAENLVGGGSVIVGARQYSFSHGQNLSDGIATSWYYWKNGRRYKTIGHVPNRFMTRTAQHIKEEAEKTFNAKGKQP